MSKHHKEAERGGLHAGSLIEVTRRDGHADRAVDAVRALLPPGSWTPFLDGFVRDLTLSAARL